MAGKSDYLENELLDHVFGKGAYSSPAPVWLGLWTVSLSDAATGSKSGEVSGGAYARISVPASKWNAASGGSISLASAVSFATATASWGTILAVGVLDASTGGNMLYWGNLSSGEQITSGDVYNFQAGTLIISED